MSISRAALAGVCTAALLLASVAPAQDEASSPDETNGADLALEVTVPEADFWVGLMGVPVNELLKSHLKIEHGLIVHAVVPDSPAAKAGLQQHDILLQFNETAIHDLASLAGAIQQNGDGEANLTIIRAGKKKSIKITPAPRPEDAVPGFPVPQPGNLRAAMDWLNKLYSGQMGQDPLQMWFVHPGVMLPENLPGELRRYGLDIGQQPDWRTTLPEGTVITITKSGEGPAKIVVSRGDQTWTVEEGQLDQLPEDLRKAVGDLLDSGSQLTIRPGELPRLRFRFDRSAPGRPKLHLRKREAEPEGEGADEDGPRRLRTRIEELRRQLRENQQRMEDELEELRRDLQAEEQTEV
jgi:hypothetical protein